MRIFFDIFLPKQMHKKQKLMNAILPQSESGVWEEAVLEWTFEASEKSQERCICSTPIETVYTIRNLCNGKIIFPIGSKCILGNINLTNFIGLERKIIGAGQHREKTLEQSFSGGYLGLDILDKKVGKLYQTFIFNDLNRQRLQTLVQLKLESIQEHGKYSGQTYREIFGDKKYMNWICLNHSANPRYKNLASFYHFLAKIEETKREEPSILSGAQIAELTAK